MAQPRKYLNKLSLKEKIEGNEERYMVLKNIMADSTLLPKTINYEDIDASFKEWVENDLKIAFNSKVLPTMVLYSNQRFTEYSQTWKYTDENKNLILNFKTVNRENNPQYGTIQGGLWNIPGDRFYLMREDIVLDDNGSESIRSLKMKQPMAVDFIYKVSIYTTNFETINDFNRLVLGKFKARQAYIFPNGHPMPMTLESVSDKSSYEIDDRQFYSQNYSIKVMGYVITEDDYKVEERPLKIGAKFHNTLSRRKANVQIEEYENPCNQPREENEYYYKPTNVIIKIPKCVKKVEFDIDTNFVAQEADQHNIRTYSITVNGEEVQNTFPLRFNDGDSISVRVAQIRSEEESMLTFYGYNPDVAYSHKEDDKEIESDSEQTIEETIYENT